MTRAELLKSQRAAALAAAGDGPPRRTSNQFFGVGPITDAAEGEAEGRLRRFDFERWLEANYRKHDDTGRDLGPFTIAEMSRSMHRGLPADKVLLDMMREIHRYFCFPKANRMAVGLGGGHSGFTVCAMHLISGDDPAQRVFIDTPEPESEAAKSGGFFRQSWGAQIVELLSLSKSGGAQRLHFAREEGVVPTADELEKLGVKLFFGVGHETTGATTYSPADIDNILAWLARDPAGRHAVFDATSMLGAMPWGEARVAEVMTKCSMFMPFQKAVGGISGYYVASFTPEALALIEANQKQPAWAIPRQLKLVPPADPKKPLTGARSVMLGPLYDAAADKMLGGVINTYSILAFAETTYGLLRTEQRIGDAAAQNRRSLRNREVITDWIAAQSLIQWGVADAARRGAAVTLLKINDPDIADPAVHARILARSKQLLAYDGITHPDGTHEPGLDVARYINAFPGTPGDYRAWIGGIRDEADVTALLENIRYAYLRAKALVLEEDLAALGEKFPPPFVTGDDIRLDDPSRAYKVLICDLVGLKRGADGRPDSSAVRAHIETKGGVFREGPLPAAGGLAPGRIHFFYQPDLSTEAEILPQTDKGQFDAVIAAATFLPKAAIFPHGGVRIGAGTGNMAAACWGGGNGENGDAPLMNTPSFNSRATAQMAFKALLAVLPDIDTNELHARTAAGDFDTGRQLRDYPTEKLEGKKLAVIGYGNIGREVAKIALAFGMRVAIHARPRHKDWIVSEGFEFAATAEDAAAGADVLSPHTGLGALDAKTGKFANAGVVSAPVLAGMNDGAVLINYDRGECVDAAALDAAMATGKVRFAAIDADLFKDAVTGKLSGPMAPYLPLAKKYPGRIQLLPHAAADTEHLSRVEGAKQAVDQIFDAIQFRRITNLKGALPPGYTNAGARTVPGVGKASSQVLSRAASEAAALRKDAEAMAAIWGALDATKSPQRLADEIGRHGATLVKAFNRYAARMRQLGLEGPYE